MVAAEAMDKVPPAPLRHADLRRADLSGVNLDGALLTGANLSSAKLNDAFLRRAELWRADLSNADRSPAPTVSEGAPRCWGTVGPEDARHPDSEVLERYSPLPRT